MNAMTDLKGLGHKMINLYFRIEQNYKVYRLGKVVYRLDINTGRRSLFDNFLLRHHTSGSSFSLF